MSTVIQNRAEYNELAEKLSDGFPVSDETFEAMVAFAKSKKIKRPVRPEAPAAEAPAPEEKKPARRMSETGDKGSPKRESSRAKNKGAKCSVKGCDRDAVAKGMCTKDYTRAYRQSDERKEAAREASRRYAAKKRAEKASA